MCALHARCLSLFDFFQSKNHRVGCDNLYISARFCKDAYKHPKQVLVHGVCRTYGRGFPQIVIQEEVQDEAAQAQVRGTVKGAVLTGDVDCPDLVAVSVYDTKPVHFLSMACKEIKWIQKKRKVYDKATSTMVDNEFLRLNINDDYNFGMGNVNIADQIRGSYRFDKWSRKFKWWHSIYWWGFQVLMVNLYQCYKTYVNEMKGDPISHYDYQKMVAHAWISGGIENHNIGAPNLCIESSISSFTESSTSTSSKGAKRVRFCNSSLHPLTGSLRGRLNHSSVCGHWPTKPHKLDYCQLCCWVYSDGNNRKRKYQNVVRCSECNISLCVGYCYEIFHDVWNLQLEKQKIRNALDSAASAAMVSTDLDEG